MKLKKLILPLLAIGSGILMALAFPPFNHSMVAFISLIPLLFAVRKTSKKQTAGLAILMGWTFFLVSLFWLHVLAHRVEGFGMQASVWLGYIFLSLLCALYFVPPILIFSMAVQRCDPYEWFHNLRIMFITTACWVAMEYLRATLFTGFSWNQLGISQYQDLVLIQTASLGGVYAVSFIIVWLNVGLYATLVQHVKTMKIRKYRVHVELLAGLLPIALTASFGLRSLFNPPRLDPSIQVALVQPNIPQMEKWDKGEAEKIRKNLLRQTQMVQRIPGLDLIVWPETAVPDFLCFSYPDYQLVQKVVRQGTPLLLGTMDAKNRTEKIFYNSSLLIHADGQIANRYQKQHLVPFGEYVPFPSIMKKFTPVEVDIQAGTNSTLFTLPNKAPFSALICFEDTVAPLSVKAVRNGARWLVNQSNDGWFEGSIEAEQHLAHAVFRAIENRVPMARCCNYGVTCSIDFYGRITSKLKPEVGGFSACPIRPSSAKNELTFYTRKGDLFAKAMLVFSGIVFVLFFLTRKKIKSTADDLGLDGKK